MIGRSWSSQVSLICHRNEGIKQMCIMVKTQGETRNMIPFKLPLTPEPVQQSHFGIYGDFLLIVSLACTGLCGINVKKIFC